MAVEWYYTRGKKEYGPVSTRELKQLAADGDLKPTDEVWKEGLPRWVPASSVKGLWRDEDDLDDDLDDDDDDYDRHRRRGRPGRPRIRRDSGSSKAPLFILLGVGVFVLLLMCGGGVYFVVNAFGSGRVNQANYDKIRVGMSETEVKDILGSPTSESDNQMGFLLLGKTLEWRYGRKLVTVNLDANRRVIGKMAFNLD